MSATLAQPVQCSHPACNKYGYEATCSAHTPIVETLASDAGIRGMGCVIAPRKVRYSRPAHVKRSEGYVAGNGAWIAVEPAPYLELMQDVATLERRAARLSRRAMQRAQEQVAALATRADVDRHLLASMTSVHVEASTR